MHNSWGFKEAEAITAHAHGYVDRQTVSLFMTPWDATLAVYLMRRIMRRMLDIIEESAWELLSI